MMAAIITSIKHNEVFVAMRTELSMKMEKSLLPVPKRFCKFVRACLDIANDEEMFSSLNNLQIITVTGKDSCCSVFFKDIEDKKEYYIKAMHIIRTFEELYKEEIEKLLPKMKEEDERRELMETCTNQFVKVTKSIDEQWNTMSYFAAFPHYINQVGLYDLKSIWLEAKSPTLHYLIIDLSHKVILGIFPEKARNRIIEKLCKLEAKLKAKRRRKNSGDVLNGKKFECEKWTINFQKLDLWTKMFLVVIRQNTDLPPSGLRLEMMTSFFPKSILPEKLPFDLHAPKPPSRITKEKDEDELQKKDHTSAETKHQEDEDELQNTDDTSAVTNHQEDEDELQKTDDRSAVTNCQDWSTYNRRQTSPLFPGVYDPEVKLIREECESLEDLSRRSKMTQAALRKEDQLILESGGTVKMQHYHSKSLHHQREVSSGTSSVLQNSLKKPKSSTRTPSMPHVPLITIKPDTKASQSSVIDLTPRDIPLIVDTPRE